MPSFVSGDKEMILWIAAGLMFYLAAGLGALYVEAYLGGKKGVHYNLSSISAAWVMWTWPVLAVACVTEWGLNKIINAVKERGMKKYVAGKKGVT